jgi:hypothetical protein
MNLTRCNTALVTIGALLVGCFAAPAVFPAKALAAGLEDIEFGSDIRLRWRWVDSGTPGPLRSTYGELIQRGISLKHRFTFDVAYPVTSRLRVGGRIRVSNEPELVLTTGPDYYSSEFGTAFIAYETPSLRSRFGFYETYYTPLTLMRWDLKDDAEGGGCPVCSSAPGTAGAILGESLEILGPVLTFEGLQFQASHGSLLGLDAFYARPRVSQESDYGLLRQVNTYGARLEVSGYLPHASDIVSAGLIAVRSEEDEGSVESLGGPPGYPPEPYKNTVYGLSFKAPILWWLALAGDVTYTRAQTWEIPDVVDKEGYGSVLSLDLEAGGVRFENAYIYLTPHWESYFRALSYSPDRKGWRSRFVVEKKTWLVSLFARNLITVNRISDTNTNRFAYPTWSVQGSYKPRPEVTISGSIVYTGAGVHEGSFDFAETSRLYSYVAAVIADIARGIKLTMENRYLNSRDYENPEFSYNANMFTLYLRAEIW